MCCVCVFVCICVHVLCVCVCVHTHAHAHTHINTNTHTPVFVRAVYFVAGFRSPTQCNETFKTKCEVKCLTIRVQKKKKHEPSYKLPQYTIFACE